MEEITGELALYHKDSAERKAFIKKVQRVRGAKIAREVRMRKAWQKLVEKQKTAL